MRQPRRRNTGRSFATEKPASASTGVVKARKLSLAVIAISASENGNRPGMPTTVATTESTSTIGRRGTKRLMASTAPAIATTASTPSSDTSTGTL
ncbi:hypothetical protein D9M72_269540 [compost metagenome]